MTTTMRTKWGKRHGWELRVDRDSYGRECWFRFGDDWSVYATETEADLWRALVRRDPEMFGVQRKGRKR